MYSQRRCGYSVCSTWRERHGVSDNLLVRFLFIIVMIRWTGLAPHLLEELGEDEEVPCQRQLGGVRQRHPSPLARLPGGAFSLGD